MRLRSRRFWDLAWAAWLIGTLGSFAWLETLALRTQRLPTLSHTLRRWMGVSARNWWGKVSPILFLGGWTALTVHVVRGEVEQAAGGRPK